MSILRRTGITRFLDRSASVVVRDTKPNQLAIVPVRRSAVVCCVFRMQVSHRLASHHGPGTGHSAEPRADGSARMHAIQSVRPCSSKADIPLRRIRLLLACTSRPQRHGVGDGAAGKADFSARVANGGCHCADRLVVANGDDLDAGGDFLADAHGLQETPFHAKENRAGPGRSSATTAFSRPEVTPPCTIRPPKGDPAASAAS